LKINHNSVYLVYPKYNWNAQIDFLGAEQEPLPELAGDASLRRLAGGKRGGKAAAGTTTAQYGSDGGGAITSVEGEDGRHYGHDVAEVSRCFKLITSSSLGIGFLLMVAGHVWITCCPTGLERQPSSPSNFASTQDDQLQEPQTSMSLSVTTNAFGRQRSEASSYARQRPDTTAFDSFAVELLKEQTALLREQNALLSQIFTRDRNSLVPQFMPQHPKAVEPLLISSCSDGKELAFTPEGDVGLDVEAQVRPLPTGVVEV